MKHLLLALSLIISTIAPAIGTEMPKKLRGLWCQDKARQLSALVSTGIYVRCRTASDMQAKIDVVDDGFHDGGTIDCDLIAITSNGNRFIVRANCSNNDTVSSPKEILLQRWRLFNNGRQLEVSNLKQTTEYRHGVSFTIPNGTNMCDEPGDYKESGKACNTAKQVWSVRLWGEPREGWCLIVHWAGVPNKPDLEMAVWKGWVDCKDLIPTSTQ